MQLNKAITHTEESALSTNRVLRNTYALLSATLFFSALMAVASMAIAPPRMLTMGMMLASFGILMFVLPKYQNSSAGVGIVFLFTGMLGFALGPMLNSYAALPNGSVVIATAMGGTASIFLALSAYVLTTKRSFDFMGGMLFVGVIVVFLGLIANMFIANAGFSMVLSGAMILLMSGFILFDTGRIINGGETNYIRATVSMFINIFNLFVHLLSLLGIMSND